MRVLGGIGHKQKIVEMMSHDKRCYLCVFNNISEVTLLSNKSVTYEVRHQANARCVVN